MNIKEGVAKTFLVWQVLFHYIKKEINQYHRSSAKLVLSIQLLKNNNLSTILV